MAGGDTKPGEVADGFVDNFEDPEKGGIFNFNPNKWVAISHQGSFL